MDQQDEVNFAISEIKLENAVQSSSSRRARHRHKKDDGCGMKAILKLLLRSWNGPPMRVKNIAAEVTKQMNENNQGYEYSVKTIQKRIYDVCLVLRTIGLVNTDMKKKVCLNNIDNKICLKQILQYNQEEEIKKKEQRIKQKRMLLYRLKEYQNILRIFKKYRERNQINETTVSNMNMKIEINTMIGVIMSPDDISINGSSVLNFQHHPDNSAVLRKFKRVISNLEMLSALL